MVYPVDLRMMKAMALHDAAGHAKDPQAWHRRDLILQRRAARRQTLFTLLRKAGQTLRSLFNSGRKGIANKARHVQK